MGAQTRRTANNRWHDKDVLEIHPFDAENRGINEGDLVSLASRAGDITLPARISERMQPGVVYTTFHHAMTGANVVTTEFSDWATNCPEYKVTAVQVQLARHMSEWQEHYLETRRLTTQIEKESTAGESQRLGKRLSMEDEYMVHMANQIAMFFASYPHEEAVAGVTDHLKCSGSPACAGRSLTTSPPADTVCTLSPSKP